MDATATCPRMRCARCGSSSSRPVTSASMSSGSHAIGSTRPRAPTNAPTSSSAVTGSSRTSMSPASRRFPTACPARAPVPPKRCCRRRVQVRLGRGGAGGELSPASAASAMRRSPGGSRPSSRRRRPDEPPSSATVTTAVMGPRRRWRAGAARTAWRQAVPAAERDGRERRRSRAPPQRPVPAASVLIRRGRPPRTECGADASWRIGYRAHSRPRSRWVTRTAMPSTSASRRPSSSLIATLRCLPPVQPTARVR